MKKMYGIVVSYEESSKLSTLGIYHSYCDAMRSFKSIACNFGIDEEYAEEKETFLTDNERTRYNFMGFDVMTFS